MEQTTFKKRAIGAVLTVSMSVISFTQEIKAQYDDDFPPPPPDFGVPPPPAPPSQDGGSHSSPSGGSGSFGSANKGGTGKALSDTSKLNKKTQDKFNRAGIEDITNENFPETIESFDFPNVEITDVIKAISELTGKNFIIDPGVRGKITIIAPSKITVAEAYKAFLSALAINGFTVVPSGNFLKVKSARNAQRDSIETFSGAYYPNSDQMITRIIHLKHISAEQVNKDLRILPSKDAEMAVYPPTNSIILSDYGSNIDRVMKIINQLDVPGFEEQMEVVPIKFAKAKDLADLVDKIVNKGQSSSRGGGIGGGAPGSFAAGVPRFSARPGGASSQQGASFFMAIPDDRTNSIIVVGNKSGIQRVKKLIAQLDFRLNLDGSSGVNVYYVKHGEAEKIAQVLSGVAKDAAPRRDSSSGPNSGFFPPPPVQDSGAGGIFGGDVKITADKNTNSLVITASKQDYEVVLGLLARLDIPRDQVFVEAIIMEMTAGDGFQFKPGYMQFAEGGIGRQGFNTLKAEEIMSPFGGAGAVLGFAEGKPVDVTIGTTTKKVPSLVGLISLLKTVAKANILSQPQVIAMDNQEALIQVGDKVVTSANTTYTQGTGQPIVTPVLEEALIELKLKPFINPTSETVRMEIDQSVKQPTSSNSSPKAFQDTTQPLATRKIKTNIVVKNKDTIVLGGLMQDRDTEKINKVPLLGDLPLLGWLFKSRETEKQKVNMLVFITPKIIRNPEDNRQILNQKIEQRLDNIKAQGGIDPYGKTMDTIQKKAAGSSNSTIE